MFSKYTKIKDNIAHDFQLLENILSPAQLTEIKDSLKAKCNNIAPTYTMKAKRQYESRRPNTDKQPKRRKMVPQRRKRDNEPDLQKFMAQLRKMLK